LTSEYEHEDQWEQWEAAYDTDPVRTAAALSHSYVQEAIAQHIPDPNLLAAQAAMQVNEINQIMADQRAADDQARLVRESLVAAHGASFAEAAPKLAERLANDQDFAKTAHDPQKQADYIEKVYLDYKRENSPEVKEWSAIKAAGQRSYWQTAEGREALKDVQ